MRATFQRVVSELVKEDDRLVLLLGDIGVFGFRNLIDSVPSRAINIGILEQAMVSFAAGLASQGNIPVVHSIAPFLVERPFEQLKIDFGYQKMAGKFVSVGASFDYSGLGATHHSPADVSALLSIPGFRVFVPSNSTELEIMLRNNISNQTLDYFRLSTQEFSDDRIEYANSLPQVLHQGTSATLIAVGPALSFSAEAAASLGLSIIYLNQITEESLRKLNELVDEIGATDLIVTQPFYEGTLVPFLDFTRRPLRVLDVGVPREFIHSYGSVPEIQKSIGLSPKNVETRMKQFISKERVS